MPFSRRSIIKFRMKNVFRKSWQLSIFQCIIFSGIYRFFIKDYLVFSEQELLSKNVHHPLFATDEHFNEKYWDRNMTQRQRLRAIEQTLDATYFALENLGIPVFLESATLIGYLRHSRKLVPWDTDADVGISYNDCKRTHATKTKLNNMLKQFVRYDLRDPTGKRDKEIHEREEKRRKKPDRVANSNSTQTSVNATENVARNVVPKALAFEEETFLSDNFSPPTTVILPVPKNSSKEETVGEYQQRFIAEKFSCDCESNCDGKDARVRGIITDTWSGVNVDIFMYAPVPKERLRSWQIDQETGESGLDANGNPIEWWERLDDRHADYTFPKDSLFPLQSYGGAGHHPAATAIWESHSSIPWLVFPHNSDKVGSNANTVWLDLSHKLHDTSQKKKKPQKTDLHPLTPMNLRQNLTKYDTRWLLSDNASTSVQGSSRLGQEAASGSSGSAFNNPGDEKALVDSTTPWEPLHENALFDYNTLSAIRYARLKGHPDGPQSEPLGLWELVCLAISRVTKGCFNFFMELRTALFSSRTADSSSKKTYHVFSNHGTADSSSTTASSSSRTADVSSINTVEMIISTKIPVKTIREGDSMDDPNCLNGKCKEGKFAEYTGLKNTGTKSQPLTTVPTQVALPYTVDSYDAAFPIRLPNKPHEFLRWEYGSCVLLGPHIWPFELLLYTPMSKMLIGILLLIVMTQKGVQHHQDALRAENGARTTSSTTGFTGSTSSSSTGSAGGANSNDTAGGGATLVGVASSSGGVASTSSGGSVASSSSAGTTSGGDLDLNSHHVSNKVVNGNRRSNAEKILPMVFVVWFLNGSGLASLVLLFMSLPWKTIFIKKKTLIMSPIALCVCLICSYDLRNIFIQLWCHIHGQYVVSLRPRAYTVCLFGYCKDFGGA